MIEKSSKLSIILKLTKMAVYKTEFENIVPFSTKNCIKKLKYIIVQIISQQDT